MRVTSINYWFTRVTSQILNTALDTLKPGILGVTVWVSRIKVAPQMSILLIRAMCCILPREYPDLP